MTHGLSSHTLAQIARVLERYPAAERAILYGSRAKQPHRAGSDIDLALVRRELTRNMLHRIADDFEDGPLPYRVDVSILGEIRHHALLEHIRRVGVSIYERRIPLTEVTC